MIRSPLFALILSQAALSKDSSSSETKKKTASGRKSGSNLEMKPSKRKPSGSEITSSKPQRAIMRSVALSGSFWLTVFVSACLTWFTMEMLYG